MKNLSTGPTVPKVENHWTIEYVEYVENWSGPIDNFFGAGIKLRPFQEHWTNFCPDQNTGSISTIWKVFSNFLWLFEFVVYHKEA